MLRTHAVIACDIFGRAFGCCGGPLHASGTLQRATQIRISYLMSLYRCHFLDIANRTASQCMKRSTSVP